MISGACFAGVENKGFLLGISKYELAYAKEFVKSIKNHDYRLCSYYLRKVSNPSIRDFLYWIAFNCDKDFNKRVLIDGSMYIINNPKQIELMELLNHKNHSHLRFKQEQKVFDYDISLLLWDSKHKEAQDRMKKFSKCKDNECFSHKIRVELQQGGKIDALEADFIRKNLYEDDGLTYDYLMWMIKHKARYNHASELLLDVQDDHYKKRSSKWWYLYKRCLREIIYNGDYEYYANAYQLAKMHRMYDDIKSFAEGEWLAGWIALEFLDRPKVAHAHFLRLYENVVRPLSISRASYWLGRSSPNRAERIKWYKKAADYPTTFYGQLAISELDVVMGMALGMHSIDITGADLAIPTGIENNKFANYMYISSLLGETSIANFITSNYVSNNFQSTKEAGYLIELAEKSGHFYGALTIARELEAKSGQLFFRALYPIVYKDIDVLPVGPELTLSVIRQESRFDHKAVSSAGAKGLMQLMPETAMVTAFQTGDRYDQNLLHSPSYNMFLGSAHLDHKLKMYDGSLILTIASYNAGSHNVDRWIGVLGDPRKMDDVKDIILWIEMVPFQETRDYIQYVLSNLQVYRYILYGYDKCNIVEDLVLPKKRSYERLY